MGHQLAIPQLDFKTWDTTFYGGVSLYLNLRTPPLFERMVVDVNCSKDTTRQRFISSDFSQIDHFHHFDHFVAFVQFSYSSVKE